MSDATHRRKRLVVKIGSATLTTSESSIDYGFLNDLADQVARVRAAGWDVVIVTSAAIACGLEALGIAKRPTDMPSLQAAASVGQSALSKMCIRDSHRPLRSNQPASNPLFKLIISLRGEFRGPGEAVESDGGLDGALRSPNASLEGELWRRARAKTLEQKDYETVTTLNYLTKSQ